MAHDHPHSRPHSRPHHGHSHESAPGAGDKVRRAFAWGVGLNVAFVIIEATAGYLTDSLSLAADAGHNFSDVLGLILAWIAHLLALRAPTRRRSYGYRRGTILASLGSAVLLTVAMGAIAWEATGRLSQPAPVPPGTVMIVAGIGFFVNAISALLFLRSRKDDLNLKGAFLHLAADAAISLGVVVGGALMWWTGQHWIDPALSLLIVAVISWGTWSLFRDSLRLAFDTVPEGIDPDAVHEFLATRQGVADVHDLHIWALSTTETALTAHIIRPDFGDNDDFLHEVACDLLERFSIHHSTIQVEREIGRQDCHAHEGHL
jgi:cobalt-zinc-cadmium efflux system protein